jgi:hypothetical protein
MNVTCGQNGWTARAFDSTGRKVAERQWFGTGEPIFDVSSWPIGRYTVQFHDEERVLVHALNVSR